MNNRVKQGNNSSQSILDLELFYKMTERLSCFYNIAIYSHGTEEYHW